jgi:hypothetical protein
VFGVQSRASLTVAGAGVGEPLGDGVVAAGDADGVGV